MSFLCKNCSDCLNRDMEWEKKVDMSNLAVDILSEEAAPLELLVVAKEYLLSFFRVNSSLEVPKF